MAKSKRAVKEIPQLFDLGEIKKASGMLRCLNHKMRQNILGLIEANGEIMVGDIYRKLKLEQSLASSYLAILRRGGVVNTRREGQAIYYSVNHRRLAEITSGTKLING